MSDNPYRATTPVIEETKRLVASIGPRLYGHHPAAISGALAELLATLLAGHFDEGGVEATADLRECILSAHIALVRELIPNQEAIVLKRTRARAS